MREPPLGEAERSYTLEKSSTGEIPVRRKIERKTEEKGKRKKRKEEETEGNEEKEENGKN